MDAACEVLLAEENGFFVIHMQEEGGRHVVKRRDRQRIRETLCLRHN